jgi:hypothetical protein
MSFVGGDIIEVTCNHPTLGDKVFSPKAGEDVTFDLGGFRTEDDDNQIAGNAQPIYKLNRRRWMVEMPVANDMNNNLEYEFLVSLTESPLDSDWTFEHRNGTVYAASGRPVGDIQLNTNASQVQLKLSGGGTLSKISG